MTDSINTASKQEFPLISIITLDYNEMDNLKRCLPSLLEQNYPNYEIVVVDNGSTDGSVEYIQANFPTVRIVDAKGNLGFAGGNNLGAAHAKGEYLVFLNPDTTVDPNWLQPLLDECRQNPDVGASTSKILLLNEPEYINTCGNDVHYTGFGYLRGWRQHSSTMTQKENVCSLSGAAFLISKSLFDTLGGFDANFFPIYVEDTDLSWRIWLAGYKCRTVPESVIYHDYTAGFGENKYYRLERNRYQMIFKVFKLPTLLVLMNALLLSEVVSWGYAVLAGRKHMQAKINAYKWLIQNTSTIAKSRRHTQSLRHVPDRVLLEQCTYLMDFGQANQGLAGSIANVIFTPLYFLHYHLSVFLVRW